MMIDLNSERAVFIWIEWAGFGFKKLKGFRSFHFGFFNFGITKN